MNPGKLNEKTPQPNAASFKSRQICRQFALGLTLVSRLFDLEKWYSASLTQVLIAYSMQKVSSSSVEAEKLQPNELERNQLLRHVSHSNSHNTGNSIHISDMKTVKRKDEIMNRQWEHTYNKPQSCFNSDLRVGVDASSLIF